MILFIIIKPTTLSFTKEKHKNGPFRLPWRLQTLKILDWWGNGQYNGLFEEASLVHEINASKHWGQWTFSCITKPHWPRWCQRRRWESLHAGKLGFKKELVK